MSQIKSELETWCASYIQAFHQEDADKIAAHWTFPAITTQGERSYSFKSADHFSKNTALLLGFYRAQGVERVERQVRNCLELHETAVAMTVSDIMYIKDSDERVTWEAVYVMQKIEGGWRAVMAVADGETEAWAARGTPLGG